jgi:hypothetical protein
MYVTGNACMKLIQTAFKSDSIHTYTIIQRCFAPLLCLLYSSCYHYLPANQEGVHELTNNVAYKFKEPPTPAALALLDTVAYYVQVFEGRYYNETEREVTIVLQFHSDGFYTSGLASTIKTRAPHHPRNAIGYGGRYQIAGTEITLERFLPLKGGETNFFTRDYSKGTIKGNRLIFDAATMPLVLEKRYQLSP